MSLIFPIVEGHGEVQALPVLLRRILHERLERFHYTISPPYRVPRSKIAAFGDDLMRAVRTGEAKVRHAAGLGGLLLVADADDDCPVEMHEKFLDFSNRANCPFPFGFVLANREYEAWFIACGRELRAQHGVRPNANSHQAPETIRAAKGYFQREILQEGTVYSETVDQAKFSSLIDLESVHRMCRSFRKLHDEVARLSAD